MMSIEDLYLKRLADFEFPGEPQPEEPMQMAQAPAQTMTDAQQPIRVGRAGVPFQPPSMQDITKPGMALFDTLAGALKGTVAQTLGLPGDVESLVRLLTGGEQVMPTTERMQEILPPVVPPGAPGAEQREQTAQVAGQLGEFVPVGITEAAKAAMAVGKNGIRKAARIDKANKPPKTEIDYKQDTNFLSAKSDAGLVGGHIKNDALRITYAEVEEAKRGQGQGLNLYRALIDEALSRGMKVTSDITVEPSAVRIYEALKKRGYDVRRLDGGVLEDGTVYGKSATMPAFEIVSSPAVTKEVQ